MYFAERLYHTLMDIKVLETLTVMRAGGYETSDE